MKSISRLYARRLRSGSLIIGIAAVFLILTTGCVSKYAIRQDEARTKMLNGDFSSAAAIYLKDEKPVDYVDVLLNRGLAQFETGDYQSAENDLNRAYNRIDELYTKSISRGALSVITNDRALAYSGTNLERGMLHYYRGLGFLAQNKTEDFSIEARALNKYLTELPELSKKSDVDFAFLRYYSGLGYDLASQPNDAWISYERARYLYPKQLGSTPPFLDAVSAIAAKRTGIISSDSLLRMHESLLDSNEGRLIVFVESGVCAGLKQEQLVIPLYETDHNDYGDNFDYDHFGRELRRRNHEHEHSDIHVVDWIRIAVPTVVRDGTTQVTDVEIASDGKIVGNAALAADLSEAFERDFSDRLPAIIARTFARTVAKRAAANYAKNEGGDGAFWLTRILGEVTETADTRSWALLPDKIFVLDRVMPAGTYTLQISATENKIQIDSVGLSNVQIKPGQLTIKRIRVRG